MLHPNTELRKISDEVGYGIFATKPIPKGTITWALDPLDQILDLHAPEQFDHHYDGSLTRYSWITARGHRILCWDFGRYMNHSCEANSYGPGGAEFEIAIRDIAAGEEITCDYATLNLEEPLMCQCGSPRCRGIVKPEDLEDNAVACDILIKNAFMCIRDVPQPLWYWVENRHVDIDRMLCQPHTIPSVLMHRWMPVQSALTSPRLVS